MSELISVVVTVYNKEKYVRRYLVRAAVGQSAERVVGAQEVESERLRDL